MPFFRAAPKTASRRLLLYPPGTNHFETSLSEDSFSETGPIAVQRLLPSELPPCLNMSSRVVEEQPVRGSPCEEHPVGE